MNWKVALVFTVLMLSGGVLALSALAFAVVTAASVAAPIFVPLLIIGLIIRSSMMGRGRNRLERKARRQGRKWQGETDDVSAGRAAAGLSPAPAPLQARGKLGEIDDAIKQLREVGAHVQSEVVKHHVASICATAGMVRDYLADRPAKLEVHGHTVSMVLSSAGNVLREYRQMAGSTAQRAARSIERLEQQTLPRVDQALDKLYDQLVADEVLNIDVAMKTLEDTLALEGIGGGELTPRHALTVPAR